MHASASMPPVRLWAGTVPHSLGTAPRDIPDMEVFLPPPSGRPATAILIAPGGGYAVLCSDYEGTNEAEWFQQHGVAAFVLKYRLPAHGYRHPVPLLDAQRAVRLIRSRAAEWNIDPAQVGMMGFSAGGHLTATLATHFDAGNPAAADLVDRLSCRPDFAVPVYAVISLKESFAHADSRRLLLGPDPDPTLIESLSNETQVTSATPPTVLVHAVDDLIVPIENSRVMYAALLKAGVPCALHEYPVGAHGFGYGIGKTPPGWMDRVVEWLQGQGLMGRAILSR